MKIRLGKKDDRKAIKTFLEDLWLFHYENEKDFINKQSLGKTNIRNYLQFCFDGSNKSYLLIGETDNEIIALCKVNIEKIERFFNENKILYIDDIYVKKEYRNQHIAQKLLKKAEDVAKKEKIKWLKARVYAFNTPAQKLFMKEKYSPLYCEYFKILK